MGDLIKGHTFTAGDVVTAAKLHALVEDAEIVAGAVGTTELADGAVTNAKLASGVSIPASGILLASGKVLVGNGSNIGAEVTVDTGTMTTAGTVGVKALGIAAAQLAADAVVTAKILNGNVTLPKLANIATARILGRSTAGSGVVEELTAGTGISISGGTVSCTVAAVEKSAEFSVTLNGTSGLLLTGAHGLGGRPKMAHLTLRCLSDELTYTGYSAGDEIPITACLADAGDYDATAFWFSVTATDYRISRIQLAPNGAIYLPKKTDGILMNLMAGNESKFAVFLHLWR